MILLFLVMLSYNQLCWKWFLQPEEILHTFLYASAYANISSGALSFGVIYKTLVDSNGWVIYFQRTWCFDFINNNVIHITYIIIIIIWHFRRYIFMPTDTIFYWIILYNIIFRWILFFISCYYWQDNLSYYHLQFHPISDTTGIHRMFHMRQVVYGSFHNSMATSSACRI